MAEPKDENKYMVALQPLRLAWRFSDNAEHMVSLSLGSIFFSEWLETTDAHSVDTVELHVLRAHLHQAIFYVDRAIKKREREGS